VNPLLWPTLALAVALAVVGWTVERRITTKSAHRATLWLLAALGALPAVLYAAYYTHRFDEAAWFYTLRSAEYSELLAAGIGFGAGSTAGLAQRSAAAAALLAALVLGVPYLKPLIAPLRMPLREEWRDGVCIQSTPSTCGPASAATLLRHLGTPATESELARECFSYGGGTENWYLARAIRRRGFGTRYLVTPPEPATPPLPSIAGTGWAGAGHFIVLLSQENGRFVVGDPLIGRLVLSPTQLRDQYRLSGFFLVVEAPPRRGG
jgi:hypothetical protein